MLDFDLIKNILIIGMASSIITTMFVQRIKETIDFKKSNYLVIVSFVVSMTLGFLFSLSFSDAGAINSLWVGLFSFLEADMIYKIFEDKIFKPFSEIQNEKVVEIPVENRIE